MSHCMGFYTTSSFVHHFKAIGEFKLELQSRNPQFGSKSAIFFVPCDLEIWLMTLNNNRAPLQYCQALHLISKSWVNSNRSYSGEILNLVQNQWFFVPCDLETLRWRHNGHNNVSNQQPHDCLLNCLFRRRSKKTWKLCVTDLCTGNSPGNGEFPAQMASNAENVSIWWFYEWPC